MLPKPGSGTPPASRRTKAASTPASIDASPASTGLAPSITAAQARKLEAALTAAGVEHTVESYAAGHGFAVPDNGSYDEPAAERHWLAMRDFFARYLPVKNT